MHRINMKRKFHTEIVGMFITYLQSKLHISVSNGSLVIEPDLSILRGPTTTQVRVDSTSEVRMAAVLATIPRSFNVERLSYLR